MNKPITIRELSKQEIDDLLSIKKFREFGPVGCSNCGFKGPFINRLFHVEGLSDINSDQGDRGIAGLYLKRTYKIEWYFFRTNDKMEFIQTAFCPKCKSNKVVFDISSKLSAELSKILKEYLKTEDRDKGD